MPETFNNGERVASAETEIEHLKTQLTDMAAELRDIKETLDEIMGALAALRWLWKAALGIGGLLAAFFGYHHSAG
jgi:hypothetical protein